LQGRVEYVNVSGLRLDGRRPREVRRVRARLGLFGWADGSTLFEQGNTKVLAVVHGPREPARRSDGEHDEAVINVDFSVAPFAASERKKRRPGDRRNTEAATALRQALEAVVETKLYPRSAIDVSVLVLQSDGGALAAAINAATLALVDAGVSMLDFVVGCSVVYIGKTPLLGAWALGGAAGGRLGRPGGLGLARRTFHFDCARLFNMALHRATHSHKPHLCALPLNLQTPTTPRRPRAVRSWRWPLRLPTGG
jgi:ribonuclease PH